MRICHILLVPFAAAGACASGLQLPTPDDLPQQVHLRTATESFNTDWYVAIRDGRIWVKPNEETGERDPGEWTLLGDSGLPEGHRLVRFDPPEEVVALSADGCHLHALSSAGVLYRGTDMRNDILRNFTWTDRWGWPAARGDGLLMPDVDLAWSVSDSHPFDVDHYEDILGIEHSVGMGVAHIYRLDGDGRHVRFNDWWLPADWSRQICTPQRGTFQAVNLSASASTLFIVGVHGELYTRLYDFDTAGENDLLVYSYVLHGPSGDTRALPAEPWLRQPDISEGAITPRITIFQDGEGNTARVLRVEGERQGATGYYEKRIDAADWVFVETGEPLGADLLPVSPTPVAADPFLDDMPFAGTLQREGSDLVFDVQVSDFNLFCSPASLRLSWHGTPVTVNGVPLDLVLHHVHTMVDEVRDDDYWQDGTAAKVRAALILPDDLDLMDDPGARQAAWTLFEERQVVNFTGEASSAGLALTELARGDIFHAPRSEKGKKGELFSLDLE